MLAVPAVSFMEAFSAFEAMRGSYQPLKQELERKIGKLKEDITPEKATRALLANLQESKIEIDAHLNEVRDRLSKAVDRLSTLVELIPLTPAGLRESVNAKTSLLRDPTDNLILVTILEHARQHKVQEAAFLTGNSSDFNVPEVKNALGGVGIKYFAATEKLLQWLARPHTP